MKKIFIGKQMLKDTVKKQVGLVCLEQSPSPLRYPGGKSKVVSELAAQVRQGRRMLVEACAGSAALSMAMLKAGLVDQVWLNEKDPLVHNFWAVMTSELGQEVLERMKANPQPTHNDFLDAKLVLQSPLRRPAANKVEHAWAYFLVNRLAHDGRVTFGPIGGYNGKQEDLLSRWNHKALLEKLQFIYDNRDKFKVTRYDVLDLLWRLPRRSADSVTVYIDPPMMMEDSPYAAEMSWVQHQELVEQVCDYTGRADILVTAEPGIMGELWEDMGADSLEGNEVLTA